MIVFGRECWDVSESDALNYVAGYAIGNDFSARTLQTATTQFMAGKTSDEFGPVGPWLVTRDRVPDPNNDDSVRIFSTPGHTPGHQSMLVRLPKTGPVMLSGDVAHFNCNFCCRRVPTFNADAEQTKQSMDKLEAIVKAEGAQLWINHDTEQNATIPHAPEWIE